MDLKGIIRTVIRSSSNNSSGTDGGSIKELPPGLTLRELRKALLFCRWCFLRADRGAVSFLLSLLDLSRMAPLQQGAHRAEPEEWVLEGEAEERKGQRDLGGGKKRLAVQGERGFSYDRG